MSNKDCEVVRDLLEFGEKDDMSLETREWINGHLQKCQSCEKWLEHKENIPRTEVLLEEESSEEEKRIIKHVKRIFWIGIAVVIFFAIWMTYWFYLG